MLTNPMLLEGAYGPNAEAFSIAGDKIAQAIRRLIASARRFTSSSAAAAEDTIRTEAPLVAAVANNAAMSSGDTLAVALNLRNVVGSDGYSFPYVCLFLSFTPTLMPEES